MERLFEFKVQKDDVQCLKLEVCFHIYHFLKT